MSERVTPAMNIIVPGVKGIKIGVRAYSRQGN